MALENMTPEQAAREARRDKAILFERLRRLFSTNKTVREDAQEALKDSWAYELPSFRVEELSEFPADNCTTLAAQRDGNKEVVTWLLQLSNSITTNEEDA